jgi:hypothetical protein
MLRLGELVVIPPYDLAAVVHPAGEGIEGTGDIDRSEAAIAVEETMGSPGDVYVQPYDLVVIVDPVGVGVDGSGAIDGGETAGGIEVSMIPGAV